MLQTNLDIEMLSPAHLNRIQRSELHGTYGSEKGISGMLLYASTEREKQSSETWIKNGHAFRCYTLGLGRQFSEIAAAPDEIEGMLASRLHDLA